MECWNQLTRMSPEASLRAWMPAIHAGMSAPVKAPHQHGESPCGVCHSSVAEGNCVGPKRRGEQPEANCRSVGERTRLGGELRRACSCMVKSENRWTRWRGGSDVQAAHVVGDGTTGRCGEVSGETCAGSGERRRSQSLHSTEAAKVARGAESKAAPREGR